MQSTKQIARMFDEYRRAIKNVWEEYNLLNYCLRKSKSDHKKESIANDFMRELLLDETQLYKYKDLDIHHFIDNLLKNRLGNRTLIDAVSMTEYYLQDLTRRVYIDYPQKLLNISIESSAYQNKLLSLVVNCANKEEMIERLIEERVRSLFYGNPVDFFLKDKARIGIGDFFKVRLANEIKVYIEVVARRNIIIHNKSQIDSKYLRETNTDQSLYNKKVTCDKAYLRQSVIVLRGLAATTTNLVLQQSYKVETRRLRISRMSKTFIDYIINLEAAR